MFLHIVEFPKCHSRKNLNCQVHQDMKLDVGQKTNSNIKTIQKTFMRSRKTRDQPQKLDWKQSRGGGGGGEEEERERNIVFLIKPRNFRRNFHTIYDFVKWTMEIIRH